MDASEHNAATPMYDFACRFLCQETCTLEERRKALYRFNIKDYHAIKEADVLVDGITVLAGPNGSGKSTISRWLYYIIDVTTRFDYYLSKGFCDELHDKLFVLKRIMRELWGTSYFLNANAIMPDIDAYISNELKASNSIEDIAEKFKIIISKFVVELGEFLQADDVTELRKSRVLNYLKKILGDSDENITLENFENKIFDEIDTMVGHLKNKQSARSLKDAYAFVANYLREEDWAPQKMQLAEEGVGIINEEVLGTLFDVDRAVYIDTPMALNTDALARNVFLQRLHEYMVRPLEVHSDRNKSLLLRISRLLNGSVEEMDDLFEEKKLIYERKDDHLRLPLEKIATGMKTFAYLFQLLKNGYLDDKTILMIDEPEVHLHPQWIVEYARLLVLIHKMLGTKLILASHDPDFISAIKAIAKREGVIGKTHFYLSSNEGMEHSNQYVFKHLGQNIEDIFDSFNIALDRIQQYGDTDF